MNERWIVAGLGNPGKKYERSWHNCGYMVLEILAQRHQLALKRIRFKGLTAEWTFAGRRVILLQPTTFMNLSGESIRQALDFYQLPSERLIVVYDDVDVELGKIRIRQAGGPGSHRGMRSIIQHLGSENFPRIRVGIGPQPEQLDIVQYVLASIGSNEQKEAFAGLCKAADAVELILAQGFSYAMNQLNGK